MRLSGRCWRPDARSAVKYRRADVVPQPLVVKYELVNRLWELVTLPLALGSPYGPRPRLRRGPTCGLDRMGGRTELVRGNVCDGPGLAPRGQAGFLHAAAAGRPTLDELLRLLLRGLELVTGGSACTSTPTMRQPGRSRGAGQRLRRLPADLPPRHAAARRLRHRPRTLDRPVVQADNIGRTTLFPRDLHRISPRT